jgi:hypothetical protein
MTRPTRMLIVLGVFGVGTVVVLSMMAQRYGKLLQRVERSRTAAPARPAPVSPLPPASDPGRASTMPELGSAEDPGRAVRSVDAFIAVRRALLELPGTGPGAGSAGAALEDEERALARALADAGLDRTSYDAILESYTAWKAGRADRSGPLPAAFALRRQELERLE